MNTLGIDLKAGQRVVLKPEVLRDEFRSLDWRTVEIVGVTTGTMIMVRFQDGEECRMSGLDIERLAEEAE